MEEVDTELVVGTVGVDGGTWLGLLNFGLNQGWVSESLVKLLDTYQTGPTSELLIGGSQQLWILKSAFACSNVLSLPTCRCESEMKRSLGCPSGTCLRGRRIRRTGTVVSPWPREQYQAAPKSLVFRAGHAVPA